MKKRKSVLKTTKLYSNSRRRLIQRHTHHKIRMRRYHFQLLEQQSEKQDSH